MRRSSVGAGVIAFVTSVVLLAITVLLGLKATSNRQFYASLIFDACSPQRYYSRPNMERIAKVRPGEWLDASQMEAISFSTLASSGPRAAAARFGHLVLISHLDQRYLVTDIQQALGELERAWGISPRMTVLLTSDYDPDVSNLIRDRLQDIVGVEIRLSGAEEFLQIPPKPFCVAILVAANGRVNELQQAATPCALRDIINSLSRPGARH